MISEPIGEPALSELSFEVGQLAGFRPDASPNIDLRYRDHLGTIVHDNPATQLRAVATDPNAQNHFLCFTMLTSRLVRA